MRVTFARFPIGNFDIRKDLIATKKPQQTSRLVLRGNLWFHRKQETGIQTGQSTGLHTQYVI